ncbi:MAG: DDE-type integrase/transposase/recombinase [Butyrivibrio sp.]|nr:DDE-type integrase/transposase/recombinase [Butyrivibrio sp.]
MNKKTKTATATEIAQFRFALIAPVIQGLFPDASRTAYYKRVTEKPLSFPDGTMRQIKYKTLEKWVSNFQRYGFDSLLPKERSDKGSTRALSDTAIEEIFRLKQDFPRLNATQIHAQLIQNGFISSTVNVCAVQRFIKHNNLKSARNPNMRDRKAFEEDAFGKMWQTDTCYFPYITEGGKSRRVFAICIIDDHTRLVVGGKLFYHDSAENFQSVFKNAVSTYGIPTKLYTDNGSPYVNEQLSLICGSIGTVLLHTKVRDGASKAKIERFWRTTKERWLYGLDIASIPSLEEFNILFNEYLRDYNTTLHTGINCTPFERYQNSVKNTLVPKSREWLNECFLNRISRKVRKDATVPINKVSYDAPMQFIDQKVEIRFRPGEMDSAFILFEGKHYPLRITDKNENCHTKRQNSLPIDYSKIGENNV